MQTHCVAHAPLPDTLLDRHQQIFIMPARCGRSDLLQLYTAANIPRLKDRPQAPLPVPAFERAADIWSVIRTGDIMVFHPYHSFEAVTHFVDEAAKDPKLLAIKMTLYRVNPASPIAQALARAAECGKEVSVLVELQARFDEEANIT